MFRIDCRTHFDYPHFVQIPRQPGAIAAAAWSGTSDAALFPVFPLITRQDLPVPTKNPVCIESAAVTGHNFQRNMEPGKPSGS